MYSRFDTILVLVLVGVVSYYTGQLVGKRLSLERCERNLASLLEHEMMQDSDRFINVPYFQYIICEGEGLK